MNKLPHNKILVVLTSVLIFISSAGYSAVHVGVSGNVKTNNMGLEVHKEQSVKGSVAVDMGSYFRVSFSMMRDVASESGYKNFSTTPDAEPIPYQYRVIENSQSVDLIAVLYSGQIFTPFVFVGGVWKQYEIYLKTEGNDGPTENEQYSSGAVPLPQGGGGLAINLSRNFSLKITYTLSPGQKEDPVTKKITTVRDQSSDIGISYVFD